MGDSNDIEGFYRAHAGAVYGYLVSLSRNRHLAEDLMQDTFVRATRAMGGYRGENPRAWLFAIARSVFLDDLRRRSRRPMVVGEHDVDASPDPDPVERDAIERALAFLPERQRSALVLSDRIGMTGLEVAETLGVSEGAARVLIHRARQGFRVAYESESR